MTCSNPIDVAVLTDYWLAALPAPEEEVVEEHLLSCDECGERLRELIALAEGIKKLAREGSLRMVVSDAFLKRAAEQGLRIREYVIPAGGAIQCTVTDKDDLLIGRLTADLSGVKRVDLRFYDSAGVERHHLTDIPMNPAAGSVILHESMTFAKASPTMQMVARLLSVDETGRENLLGEYTFNHTRSLPGPGAW